VQTGFETPTAVTKIVPKTRCSVRFSYLFASSPLCQRRVDPLHIQSYAVSTCSRTQIQGLAVVISRCKVVGMFGANNRPQMLALWRDDPKSARPGYVQVSLLIELHAESVLAWGTRHVEEDFSGTVTATRYQLKQSLPVERRASSVLGSITCQLESSKSKAPACRV